MPESPLAAVHQRLGARLTDFAGWQMPLSFTGTPDEHTTVREQAGLFDLCHMGRLRLTGPDAQSLLEYVTPADIAGLAQHHCRYTVVLQADGGIVDDIIVTRMPDGVFLLCVNASNRQAVVEHLHDHRHDRAVEIVDISDSVSQIAIQGPASAGLITSLLDGPLPEFMSVATGSFDEVPLIVSRTGYSGELGVELFVPAAIVVPLWEALLLDAAPCGLGARDTLRLEMGYPLYGHELTRQVTPVEAGLSWSVDWDRGGYLGHDVLHQHRQTPATRLVGFVLTGPGIPRAGCDVLIDGQVVGEVTSGNMGLTVGRGVGMAYLPITHSKAGTELTIDVRGRLLTAWVTRPPFYLRGTVREAVSTP